jgi:hypothetical protein
MSVAVPDFPYPLKAVPGAEAVSQWRTLQNYWRQEGCSAVLVGDIEDVIHHRENFGYRKASVESILEASKTLDAAKYLKDRFARGEDFYSGVEKGTWPATAGAPHQLTAHLNLLTRRPKDTVFFAMIPTVESFEIPGFLKYGGWNECPGPAEQVAMFRRWSKNHGVEIYAMLGDVIECEISHPPESRQAASALAFEQFVFCSDIVYQGTQTLYRLAASLQNARHWFFWWD